MTLAPCRCGAAPTAFQSERTGQYVVCCRVADCDFADVVAEDAPRVAVERWAAVVATSKSPVAARSGHRAVAEGP